MQTTVSRKINLLQCFKFIFEKNKIHIFSDQELELLPIISENFPFTSLSFQCEEPLDIENIEQGANFVNCLKDLNNILVINIKVNDSLEDLIINKLVENSINKAVILLMLISNKYYKIYWKGKTVSFFWHLENQISKENKDVCKFIVNYFVNAVNENGEQSFFI